MCGITGFMIKEEKSDLFEKAMNRNNREKEQETILRAMMNQIIHRGPDGSGIYVDFYIALGHRRLSIIDIEGGRQPMENEDGRLICIFNGEIYNYTKLKELLMEKGHVFVTKSDTEVLLHGYEEWGEQLPEKLRGMFAFAIWDRQEKKLFCTRDYFGIKPFYYYHKDDVFMFGSEIKCFLPHPDFEKELNKEQLELYLSYQYSPGENTFFKNVYKLPPAHSISLQEGRLETRRYWKPKFDIEEKMDKKSGITAIREVMKDSVKVHKISDVEVGSFLSSGVDSSYIAALSKVNKTFTIGYDNSVYSEGDEVKDFAKTMGLPNKMYYVNPEDYWENLSKVQYYMDEPLADASAVALYLLNHEASKEVKVCLSGEGADEVFGGYNIYKEPYMCKWYDSMPKVIRCSLGCVAKLLPSMPGVNFLVRHSKPLKERYIGNTCLFSERQKKRLLKEYCGNVLPMDLIKEKIGFTEEMDDVTRMQLTDIYMWLTGDILLKADKMSMANSLELRVPFLDKEVFSVARKIPTNYRVNTKQTKILLRKAANSEIGNINAERTKKGFPVPVREWLKQEPYRNDVKKQFESIAAKEFFCTEYLMKMLEEHKAGKHDWWREIWCVYMFLIWYEIYFEKKKK